MVKLLAVVAIHQATPMLQIVGERLQIAWLCRDGRLVLLLAVVGVLQIGVDQ